jgi:hypothetical protein
MPDHRPARDLHPPSTTGSMPTPADASCAQNSQICMGFALIGDKLKLAQNGGSLRELAKISVTARDRSH